MSGMGCATKYFAASGTIAAGTDFPATATQVYIHWMHINTNVAGADATLEYPAGTVKTLLRAWNPDGNQPMMMNPAMRIPLTAADGGAITLTLAANAKVTVGYTWS